MNTKITDIEVFKPHCTIITSDDVAHVVPISVIENMASGKTPMSDVDMGEYELIIRRIIEEWLVSTYDPVARHNSFCEAQQKMFLDTPSVVDDGLSYEPPSIEEIKEKEDES